MLDNLYTSSQFPHDPTVLVEVNLNGTHVPNVKLRENAPSARQKSRQSDEIRKIKIALPHRIEGLQKRNERPVAKVEIVHSQRGLDLLKREHAVTIFVHVSEGCLDRYERPFPRQEDSF